MSNTFFSLTDNSNPGNPENSLECKICGYKYDPAVGDSEAQIPGGTAFSALPEQWRCPVCDSSKQDFLVIGV